MSIEEMDKVELLSALAAEIDVCTQCRLCQTRTYAVPGEGSPAASIMLVGEGPGEQEDLSGRPFVGKSGQLLTRELEKIGIRREHIFITNIVKCRPPQNRDPLPDEIAACNDWLTAQIALVDPKFIVPIGGPSLKTLVSPKLGITRARSQVYRKDGILFIPILHPAAALRSPVTMEQFKQDLMNLKEFLNREIGEEEIHDVALMDAPKTPIKAVTSTPAKTEEDGGTLSLF